MKHFLIPLVTLLAVLCGGVAWAGSASAHADLVSSSPQDGDVLDAPPTELVFTFNEPLLPDFVRFIATSPDGQTGDLIITGVDGNPAFLKDGSYEEYNNSPGNAGCPAFSEMSSYDTNLFPPKL